jgi:hypothetical protein
MSTANKIVQFQVVQPNEGGLELYWLENSGDLFRRKLTDDDVWIIEQFDTIGNEWKEAD